MGLHVSDGLAGKVAAAESARFVMRRHGLGGGEDARDAAARELRRAEADAPGGYVGVNLMAAINHDDFEHLARAAIEEGVSFIVQGAGISREVVRWCREAGMPFAGIVSSGRLAAMYEKWGAEFLVAEGAEAGGHIGDIELPARSLVEDVSATRRCRWWRPAGSTRADVAALLAHGAAGVQLATRFIACSDGDAHPAFKEMHLGKERRGRRRDHELREGHEGAGGAERLHGARSPRGACFPPRSKAWFFGEDGYRGRKKACIECLADEPLQVPRERLPGELLHHRRAPARGDPRRPVDGLFYTGQSVTQIPERSVRDLKTVQEIVAGLELAVDEWERREASSPRYAPGEEPVCSDP